MSNIVIEPVNTRKGMSEYVQFPFKLYKDDPCWVPPLIEERLAYFDPKKNPFCEHCALPALRRAARRADWSARSARWSTTTTTRSTRSWRAAGASSSRSTTRRFPALLLQAAEDWCRLQGMNLIRGPLNFSTNDEVGMLIDGFDTPPMIMMTHNPRYYPSLDRSHGYVKAMDLFAWIYDIQKALDEAPQKLYRVSAEGDGEARPARA